MSKRKIATAAPRTPARPAAAPSRRAPLALLLATTALTSPLMIAPVHAQTLPTGASVAAGSVAISQPSATQLTVTQSSQSAVVNYQSFSVGQGSNVTFAQPNASSAILNRVTGNTSSNIAGSITANGQVYLVNPNGIAITPTGTVNTSGGFVASTLGISDSDFMAGKRSFTGNGASAGVSNAGAIRVGRGGYAALIGGTVSNSGSIDVPLGKVGLGSGEQATLDFAGDGFLQVAMPTNAKSNGALIRNSGTITADGGSVVISAATAREAARNAINISGTIQARSIGGRNGSITIGGGGGGRVKITGRLIATSRYATGGRIVVTGQAIKLKGATVDASGARGGGSINIGGGRQGQGALQRADTVSIDSKTTIKADATQRGNGGNVTVWSDGATAVHGLISATGGPNGGDGGQIETSGHTLDFAGIRIHASAANGKSGTWLLDPEDLTVDATAAGTISTVLDGGTNVTLLTTSTAASGIGNTSTGNGDIFINSSIGWASSALLTLNAYNAISINAPINVAGNGGVTLTYNTASPTNLTFRNGASIDYGAANNGGTLSVNGQNYALVYTMADLAGIDTNGRSALATSLFATSDGTANGTPTNYTGSVVGTLRGTFEGLGHTISNLTITSTTDNATVGLFGTVSGGTVRDIGLVGGTVTGTDNSSGGRVGALVGLLTTVGNGTPASVVNAFASTTVSGGARVDVGGLVGQAVTSGAPTLIVNSYATGTVTAGQFGNAGGLVGFNNANASAATISGSYATGAVTTGDNGSAGGLTAVNYAFSDNAYVTNSYATGAVSGGSNATLGGLVGQNSSRIGTTASIANAYATGAVVSAAGTAGGLVGTNSAAASSALISDAFATGAVSGFIVGGLVGNNSSSSFNGDTTLTSITNAYATGAVAGVRYGQTGGLIGLLSTYGNNATALVSNAYSTGQVMGVPAFVTYIGGSIGWTYLTGGTISISKVSWDTTTSGQSGGIGVDGAGNSGNVAGLTTRQLQGLDPLSGNTYFSTATNLGNGTSVFSGGAGGLYPYLTSFFPGGLQVVSGTVYADGGATPLASGGAGAVTVNVMAGGATFGSATTGANGYYYAFGAAGSVANGQAMLATTNANPATGATDAVALVTATGATTTNIALYGHTLSAPTSQATLSAAIPDAKANASAAAGGNANALSAIQGTTDYDLVSSAASFTIDQAVTTSNRFGIQTTASGAGITVANPITINSGGSLNLNAAGALAVNAPLTAQGAVAVNLGYDASSPGNLTFAIGAPLTFTDSGGNAISSSAGGSLSINGTPYTLLYSMADVANINSNLGGNYALATSLDASTSSYTTGIVAGGNSSGATTAFSGAFEGLGQTIANLTITDGSNYNVGLFGYSTGTIRDIGLTGGSVSGTAYVGGLVGYQSGGAISNAYATGAVSGYGGIGGLVGAQYGGTISNAYATGAVSGSQFVGGLVGAQYGGTISNVYATGAVSANGNGNGNVGGLVGAQFGGTISNAYATGAVSGNVSVGGLVGALSSNSGSTIGNSYWDTQTSGRPNNGVGYDGNGQSGNITGLTTAQFQSGGASGLGSAFAGGANGLYPYLASFYPGGVQAISGIAYRTGATGVLASGTGQDAGLVTVMGNGAVLNTVSTGANGYYYVAASAGTLAANAPVLAYTVANANNGATNAATVTASTGGATLAGVNIYGSTLSGTVSDTTLSAASASLASAANAAAGSNSAAQSAISGAAGRYFTATGSSFTIDQTVSTSGVFGVQTTAASAPITVAQPITVNNSDSLILQASGALAINAPVSVNGAGTVVLAASLDTTTAAGVSLLNLSFAPGASIDYGAINNGGTLAISGQSYGLLYSMSDVANVNTNLAGRYALATNIDATGNTYAGAVIAPGLPYNAPVFSGTLTGLGHAIANLSISNSTDLTAVGLVGLSTGTIRDLNLVGGSVATTGTANSTGALVGYNQGIIASVSSSVAVSGGVRADYIGGLVGLSDGSSQNVAIVNASVTGAVSITSGNVGGLVGLQQGGNGYTATIANSFATGAVSAVYGNTAGGLIGISQAVDGGTAAITNSYATGNVTIGGQTSIGGGLVGQNAAVRGGAVASLTNVYATGVVSVSGSQATAGALIGDNSIYDQGTTPVVNAYWDVTTSGRSNAIGSGSDPGTILGLTTRQLQGLDTITSLGRTFSFTTDLGNGTTSAFAGGAGGLYPYLASFFPNGVQVVSGYSYADAGLTPSAPRTIGVIGGGVPFASASSGANGYYYGFGALGLIAPNATLLAHNGVNAATLTFKDGATIQNVNLYGNALTIPTTAISLSAAPSLADAQTTALAATGGNAAATNAINNANGRGFVATGSAGFTIDQAVSGADTFYVQTTAANAGITVSQSLTVQAGGSLGLLAAGALAINAPVTAQGAASINLAYDASSPTNLSFGLTGSGFTGGLTFTNADGSLASSSQGGALVINKQSYGLLYNMTDVEAVNGNLVGNYAIATNIDASASVANPYTTALVGSDQTSFSGTLTGLGHTIANLTITGSSDNVGLIRTLDGGMVRDIGMLGGRIAGDFSVGGLVGFNDGTIAQSYATGAVSGNFFTGGLVGNNNGTITQSYATGAVSGTSSYTGGLVGSNDGQITQAYATGTVSGSSNAGGLAGMNQGAITQAYATGAVSGSSFAGGLVGYSIGTVGQAYATGAVSGSDAAGGLVGQSAGAITQSYATGAVSGSQKVGGLIGANFGPVSQAYATGAVSGSSDVGGLIGLNGGVGVTQGYWDTQTSGLANSAGGIGLTTRQLQGLDPINGNAFSVAGNLGDGNTSAFAGGANGLYPYLSSFFPNGVQVISGYAYADPGLTPATPRTIGVIGGGTPFASASSGANGYYYAFGAAGSIATNASLLATINANSASGAKDSATLTAANGTAVNGNSSLQTGVNLYDGALVASTSEITLSAANVVVPAAAITAANGNAAALSAISGATGRYYTATGASFTIDSDVVTSRVFSVTTVPGAPLTVNNPITIGDGGSLALLSGGPLAINAPLTANGAVAVNLGYDASNPTNLSFGLTGAGFTGGLTFANADGTAASASQGGTLAINGQSYTLLYNLGSTGASNAIQDIDTLGLSGNYALATNLDGTGTIFTSALAGANYTYLGSGAFAGAFEGLGHTISNLTIASSTQYANVGLFGVNSGTIRDIGIVAGAVSGTGYSQNLGLLAGKSFGYNAAAVIANAYTTGAVSDSVGGASVGGLVGSSYSEVSGSAVIVNSFASVTVSGGQGSNVGGLAGSSGGTIANSYATGPVQISSDGTIGGLIGQQFTGSITNSYATGAVIGGNNSTAGGLIGLQAVYNDAVSLNNVYATGAVVGTGQYANVGVGGLIGQSSVFGGGSITIANAYWDTNTSGRANGIGDDQVGQSGNIVGLTTRQLQGLDPVNGNAFSVASNLGDGTNTAFSGGAGGLYPYLTSFFPRGVQVVSGTAYSDAVGTPLASNAGGAVTVNVVGGGVTLGSATTGANGYYYAFGQPGTIASGSALLAYINANVPAGAKSSVTLTTAGGAPVNTSTLQTGVDLYNGAFAAPTSELTLSAAAPATIAALNAALTNNLAALPAAVGVFAVPSPGRYYTATGASFTIDQSVTTSNIFGVSTTAGAPLTVASPITITTGGSLGLLSGGALAINAPINVNGAGSVGLAYDASSPINLTFASGKGLNFNDASGNATATGTGGALTINGQGYTLLYSMADLDAIDGHNGVSDSAATAPVGPGGTGLNGRYALAGNFDAAGVTYIASPIRYDMNIGTAFGGVLEGLGHTVSNLTVNDQSSFPYYTGLIDNTDQNAVIRDIGVVGGSITGQQYTGGLVGANYGLIANAYSTAAVTGTATVGGLVGYNQPSGILTNVWTAGIVTGSSGTTGGLVGLNGGGRITNAVSASYVRDNYQVGGLVGWNSGTVTGAVATGAVVGGAQVGGLVGFNDNNGVISQGYFDTATTGRMAAIGYDLNAQAGNVAGLATMQLQSSAVSGNLGAAFGGADGLYPYLASFFPNGVQAVSGFAYTDGGVTPLASGTNGAATVSVASNGQTLGSVTTGANGYYYAVVPMGTLNNSAGVAAYTRADVATGAADAVSYQSGTPDTLTRLDIAGGWRLDTTLLSSLSTLDAGFATTTTGTPVASFTLPNRSIFALNDFALDSAVSVTGTLNLATIGNVTQTAALSAGTLLLEGSNSVSFTLTNTGNQFSRFAASGGAYDVYSANSLAIAANVSTACGCVVSGVAATGTVRIATAGDLTIESGAGVLGDSPVLAAADAFINNAGASAVTATSGRWLVYAADSTGNTFGGLDSGNTAVWNTAPGATVTPTGNRYAFAAGRTLTVTTTNDSKIYGEDITARVATRSTIAGFDPGVAGAYLADDATTSYSGAASVTSAGAGATANVAGSPYAVTASLGSLESTSGYSFDFANSGLLTVDRRNISVTANAQSRSYGNANPALTYVVGGLALVNGDALSGGLATSANATSNVGTYAITQGTLSNANYALTYTGANLGVTARALTVTADAQSRIYGDANPALTYSVGGLGLVNGDALSGGLATSANATSNVGTYAITQGTVAATSNYALTYVGANLGVTARALTVTADAQSRIYGDANPALTYVVGGSGLVNGDMLSGGLATSANTKSNVGSYGITQGMLAASSNYAISYIGANLGVTARPLSVVYTAAAATSIYGNTPAGLTGTVSSAGLVNNDEVGGTASWTTGATAVSNIGRYSVIGSGVTANGNYALSSSQAPSNAIALTISPRPIAVTSDPQSRIYGNANPALTYAIGGLGLVNGDVLSGGLTTSATTPSAVGSYDITQGTLAANSNYALTYAGALLTVTPAVQQSVPLTPVIDTTVLASRIVRDSVDWIALPDSATPLLGAAPIMTTFGVGSFYSDPRFDRVLVCFGGGVGVAPSCLVAGR